MLMLQYDPCSTDRERANTRDCEGLVRGLGAEESEMKW